ncbi:MAG TPA: hypothetical protein VKS79_25805 [Gemmataceae bacterium]|nr:hypothetical protein [Gemmataceae bacterium]
MRLGMALVCVFAVGTAAWAQEKKAEPPPPRYGVKADLEAYPQGSAKEAMKSIATALERTRVDYILAHLTDPLFVDSRVKEFNGNFEGLVRDTEEHLADPKRRQEFVRFLKEGTVEESGTSAKVTLKDVPKKQMTLRQSGGRWFLDNESEADKPKK